MSTPSRTASENGRTWADVTALAASALCLIHCLVLPAVALLLPFLAATVALPESFHRWAFAAAVPTSVAAMLLGHARHRRAKPAAVALPGLALLGVGAWALSGVGEVLASTLGAGLLIVAHLLNWRGAVRA